MARTTVVNDARVTADVPCQHVFPPSLLPPLPTTLADVPSPTAPERIIKFLPLGFDRDVLLSEAAVKSRAGGSSRVFRIMDGLAAF